MKKNLFSIGLAFSVILGVAFSFLPQEVEAYVRMESELAREKIPCDSNSSQSTDTYTACSSCTSEPGKGYNGGKCRRN